MTELSGAQKERQNNLGLQRTVAIASSVLLIAKFIAYYLTHSVSVLTDALESIVNVVAGVIGLHSLYVVGKAREKDHPYGHGKGEFGSAGEEGPVVLCAVVLLLFNADKDLNYLVITDGIV